MKNFWVRNIKEVDREERERSTENFWGKKGSNVVGRERGRSKCQKKKVREENRIEGRVREIKEQRKNAGEQKLKKNPGESTISRREKRRRERGRSPPSLFFFLFKPMQGER